MSVDTRCLTCRSRRVKCDGVKPSCGRCNKAGLECLHPDLAVSGYSDRARFACQQCRRRKIRCSGTESADEAVICARCERLGLGCVWTHERHYTPRRSSAKEISDSSPPTVIIQASTSIDHMLANRAELLHHIRNYFSTVHHVGFLTFIHEPTFLRLLDLQNAPKELTTMMVICSLHFAGDHSVTTIKRAADLYQGTYTVIQSNVFKRFGCVDLMTLLLARAYEGALGHFVTSWTMGGMAVRMMQFLALHTFDFTYKTNTMPRISPLLKPEALRRLAWAVFYLDTMADAGQHGAHLLTESSFRIQLPSDEDSFIRGEEIKTIGLHPPLAILPNFRPKLGISAHLIRTAAMRRLVLHFNSLIPHSEDSSAKMMENLVRFEENLKTMVSDLPSDLVYTEHNVFIHAQRFPAFFFLHLLRHNCFLMLAEARLNVCSRDASLKEAARQALRERLRHALPVGRIVGDITRLGVFCGPAAGVQAYTSLEVLLLDPPQLAQTDPTIDPQSPQYTKQIQTLFNYIRQHAQTDEGNRLLHVEASGRMIKCGFQQMLTPTDIEVYNREHPPDEDLDFGAFDFRAFPFHRKAVGRSGYTFLDPAFSSGLSSRAPSIDRELDDVDASAVAGTSSSVDLPSLDYSAVEQAFVNDDTQLDLSFDTTFNTSTNDEVQDDWSRWWEMTGHIGSVELDPMSWMREQ